MTRRGRTVLRLLALAMVAIAVGLVVSTRQSSGAEAAAAASPAPALRTPVWSARRVPGLFVEAAAKSRLARQLAQAVKPYDACVAVDDDSGTVAEIGGDRALAPASTTKLITGVAALTVLGPDHRFTTRASVAPNGDLVVVGGGDPLLATSTFIAHEHAQPRFHDAPYTDLGRLADAIVAAHVNDVASIVVDDRRHDSLRFLPGWKPNYVPDGEIGALGALSVDSGFADPIGRRTTQDPAVLTGQRLAELLRGARGVTVHGGVAHGAAPSGAREIAHVDSAPLSAIVEEMLTASDDYTAEILMREIGASAANGRPATTQMGIATAMTTLGRIGVPHANTDLQDGSGLSPGDRVACPTLLAIVDTISQPRYAALDRGLPVANRTGTLAGRFGGDPLAGVLRAKTGSIDGVVALAGTIDAGDHPDFAFIANGGFSDATGAGLQTTVAHIVAAYPQAVDASKLVPAP